jgi:hypothetical protein
MEPFLYGLDCNLSVAKHDLALAVCKIANTRQDAIFVQEGNYFFDVLTSHFLLDQGLQVDLLFCIFLELKNYKLQDLKTCLF